MSQSQRRKLPLHTKIMIGMLLGIVAGFACREIFASDPLPLKSFADSYVFPIGKLFMNLIFMIVVPLLFSALVLGVADIGDIKRIGRMGGRTLLMTVILSGIAVLIGVAGVNLVQPGAGLSQEKRQELWSKFGEGKSGPAGQAQALDANVQTALENSAKQKSAVQTLVDFVPKNPFEEAVRALEGGILPLMFFALFFGIALSMADPEKVLALKQFLEGLFAVSLKVIDMAMAFAPIGVFALIFNVTVSVGFEAFLALGKYAALVLTCLAIHQFVTYSIAIKLVTKRNPVDFFKRIRGVMITAFATSSSNATLPAALKSANEDLGLPQDISSFVLTIGATANQNGTALFEGITVIFLAQVFGIELSVGQQFLVMFMSILAGVGTAGVPGGSWPMIAAVVKSIGVPGAAIGYVMGIDRILDMSRTVLNVSGDITIATCVSAMEERSEGRRLSLENVDV